MAAPTDNPAPGATTLLKDSPEAIVELVAMPAGAQVRKTYRNRGLAWLQTFARRSRGAREFGNLTAVHRWGIACTVPLSCSEQRRFGCVDTSTLVTEHLADAQTLKHFLAQHERGQYHQVRRQIVRAAGTLLRQLHDGGILWSTPMPRNMLLVGDPSRAQLAVCDVPNAIVFGRPIAARPPATIDLFRAAFSPSRCRDYSRVERLRWLLAYTRADRALARRLWRTLCRRTTMGNDLRRALSTVRNVYLGRRPMPSNAP